MPRAPQPKAAPKIRRATIDQRILIALKASAAPLTIQQICQSLWPEQSWLALHRVTPARPWPELASAAWYVWWRAGILTRRGLLRRIERTETDQFQVTGRRVGNA